MRSSILSPPLRDEKRIRAKTFDWGIKSVEAYAVVETGGKQYRVQAGDVFQVERLEADVGKQIDLDRVLAVSDGNELNIGTPVIDGAKISATIVEHKRGPKVVAFKKKRRKGYSRKVGHRQELTVLRVESVS
jgi:large subunit ribosomal protein L21